MVLSCSAVRVVCHISNGVLIMILHQELKDSLNEQIDYMKRKLFDSSREKMEQQTDGQLSFNLSDEADETIEELPAVEEEIFVKKHTRKKNR